ncbi:DUF2306 domain-containing protein [Patiriisocius sp. Uisw_017]|jgi:uncharacterized membrane protein|uniref:DUF2306 domain-containing protein n=1 Tax=Patiriisocius sp. Uisw_017 TaxID=3230968 RepID=UPI0039EB11D1
METAAILIYIHAGFGGLALIFGSLAIVFKKGSKKHRASGKYFFHSMIISAVIALLIACLPGHHSPFLFSIGLFSLYFLITGYSALRFKKKIDRVTIDIIGNISMLVIASCMVLLPLIIYGVVNIVLLVFGLLGILAALNTIRVLRKKEMLKERWLRMHLGNMMGGYIAAVSAFAVVNQILPGIYNWFVPGIIGGVYIYYWMRKIRLAKRT